MISVSTRISRISSSKRHLTTNLRQSRIASRIRRYAQVPKHPYEGLDSDIATKQLKRFANEPSDPAPAVTLPPVVKTWIKAETVFTTPDKTNLANRQMGTIEQAFCKLSNYGLPTTSVRLFRCHIFLDDAVMYDALEALQRMRPELWGTAPRRFESRPAYVNTYDPVDGPEEPEVKAPSDVPKNLEAAMKAQQQYTAMPKHFVPIPLEVIEGGDQSTYLSEMTNLLNHPFEEGAPLLKIRIIRHTGGSDLLVAAHQALFDEASLGNLCLQILELYDLSSEGRTNSVAKQTFQMISSVDDLYPAAFRTERDRLGSRLLHSNKLAKLSMAHPWTRFPYTSEFPSASVTTPPSPLLNASAAIFGKLSIEASSKFARKCQKQNATLESSIAAAVLLSAASIMREHQKPTKDSTRDISRTETNKKRGRKSAKQSKQNKSPTELPNEKDETKRVLLENIADLFKVSIKEKQEPDLTIVPFIASLVFSLRSFFDPPMAPPIIGYLNSHLLLPVHISAKDSIWQIAKNVTEVKHYSNYDNAIYNDLLLLPHFAELCLSDTKWRDVSIPTLTISDTTSNTLLPETRDRFAIYDTKAINSCWMPGIQVSSHIEQDQLQISISYRRPLIPDKIAHQLLIATLKQLSL